MPLTPKGRQVLKARAHALKPVVLIGNQGLSEAVLKEIHRALHDHELIKVKVASEDREERQAVIAAICDATEAQLVQTIGRIGVFYKPRKD
jgi:RNA-binding protein